MDITPETHFIQSIRARRGDIVKLCCEAVDNAFDASARRIWIDIEKHRILFRDDGNGIPEDRFEYLYKIGAHAHLIGTRLGMFGVGIKVTAISAADIMTVFSVSKDRAFRASVNWNNVEKNGWNVEDPIRVQVPPEWKKGTSITLTGLRITKKPDMDKIIDELRQRFSPAIKGGRLITVNGTTVPAIEYPKVSDAVRKELKFSGGRSALVNGGLLAEPSNMSNVYVSYGHRVIMPRSNFGCGDHSGLNNMYARVHLDGKWGLSELKNDIANERHRNELEAEILEALEPILKKCTTSSFVVKLSSIEKKLNEMLSDYEVSRRPHKNDKDHSGKPHRQSLSGYVDPNKSDPDGPAQSRRAANSRLIITFDGQDAIDGIGAFKPGRPNRVNLSRDNPTIKAFIDQRSEKVRLSFLFTTAIILFEAGRREADPQLPGDRESLGIVVAKHLEVNKDRPFETEPSE